MLAYCPYLKQELYWTDISFLLNNPVPVDHESLFLEFFSKKTNFPYKPEFIKIIQTHISIVCIAPPFVFKAKKNIKLTFLDYSSISKRKHLILKEQSLNQRLCSGIYLHIVPIYIHNKKLSFLESPEIFDYALKMNFMPDEFNLEYLLKQKKLTEPQLNLISAYLASFYKNQKSLYESEKLLVFKPLSIIKQNIKEIKSGFSSILPFSSLEAVNFYTNSFIKKNLNLFLQRYQQGFIKDCHGDLRIEHIYLLKKQICIYDCIEFNDYFRKIDILCDIAFLSMEFDFMGHFETGNKLVTKISALLQDKKNFSLMNFYKVYRAMVRVKVNSILSRELEIKKTIRDAAFKKSSEFLALSLKYCLSGDVSLVIVIMGKTASGKSTISDLISRDLKCNRISTDETRKTLAKIDLWKKTPEKLKPKIYSPGFSNKVYSNVIKLAVEKLSEKKIIVIDGTFSKQKYRFQVLRKFSKSRVIFVELITSSNETEKRLKARENKKTVSDARLKDKIIIDSMYEPPDELISANKLTIKNYKSPELVVFEIYKNIINSNH
jgi:hypothetical protein